MNDATDYQKLLDDLIEERSSIDNLIVFVEKRLARNGANPSVPSAEGSKSPEPQRFPRMLAPDTFFRMSVPQAIKTFLNIAKRPRNATDITRALESGGLTHQAKNLYATVYPTLLRMEAGNEVVRIGKKEWGLSEWYPSGKKASQEEKSESES